MQRLIAIYSLEVEGFKSFPFPFPFPRGVGETGRLIFPHARACLIDFSIMPIMD